MQEVHEYPGPSYYLLQPRSTMLDELCIQTREMTIIDSYKAGSAVMKSVFNERLTAMRKAFRKAFIDNRINDPAILDRATRSDCRDVFAPESMSWDPRPRSGSVSPQVSAPSLDMITAALESDSAQTQQEPHVPLEGRAR